MHVIYQKLQSTSTPFNETTRLGSLLSKKISMKRMKVISESASSMNHSYHQSLGEDHHIKQFRVGFLLPMK